MNISKVVVCVACTLLLSTVIVMLAKKNSQEVNVGPRIREQDRNQVCDLILDRWSPRALSGEKVSQKELETLFKAASWAPSCYNLQPWRFIYAHRDSAQWQQFVELMVPFNQEWAKNAGVLVIVVSKKKFDHVDAECSSHSLDTGAACQNLALQAWDMGLVVHAMGGFDAARAKSELHVADDYTVETMLAIGRPGRKENLSKMMQEREMPSDRKQLAEFVFEGSM